MTEQDYENMSDEDFAKLQEPVAEEPVEEPAPVEEEPAPEAEAAPVEETPAAEEAASTDSSEGGDVPGSEEDASGSDVDDDAFLKADHTTPKQDKAKPEEKPAAEPEPAAQAEGEGEEQKEEKAEPVSEEPEAPSAEDNYAKIMAPFKANGTEFTPKSPEEVIRLMQMGANYSQKMQALKPNLRMMRMLENKGLLDEEKLNFLIDVNDRNPKAIQKLLQEAKIDPLDLDTSEPVQYKPNNHAVSEDQFAFQEAIQDLQSTDSGKETIQTIHQSWDQASKEEVFKDPRILSLIDEQRQNGIYSKITSELSRQRMLGEFEGVPFIHAYKAVGDYLHQRGELIEATPAAAPQDAQTGGNAPQPAKPRAVVETRTATPKAPLANDDRVASTAPPRSTVQPQKSFDPFNMSDEEIMRMSLPHS